jgi:hypothetical protein
MSEIERLCLLGGWALMLAATSSLAACSIANLGFGINFN